MKKYRKYQYICTIAIAFFAAMFFNTVSAQAANLKTKTFTINDLGTDTTIELIGVKDSTGDDRNETSSGWQHGGSISISLHGSTAKIVMSDCNVTDWTPYLQITTAKTGYKPTGWETGTLGGNGMNYGTVEVHNLTDTWKDGSCRFYIGLGYSYNDVYATWSPWKHTVAYDADGGSGAPGNQTKTYGIALKLSSKKPTRAGYTFEEWKCSKGGTYQPGDAYKKDYNGGTVTMKAAWADDIPPTINSVTAAPTAWNAKNGTVIVKASDQGSGINKIVLTRYSYVTEETTVVAIWYHDGSTTAVTDTYTEKSEGVFRYSATITDVVGNASAKTSDIMRLDHSNPTVYGISNVVTGWTNVAPVINITSSDCLAGTMYSGSGVKSVVIKDDSENTVASGTTAANYTLSPKYEGVHTWYVTVTDNVDHSVSASVTTKYDITKPGIDGTEKTLLQNGTTVSGYCQDDIIDQSVDDKAERSSNQPNVTSGLKNVITYKVVDGIKTAMNSSRTRGTFASSDTNSSFRVYDDITEGDKNVDYYLIVAEDYAGNIETKKLISQNSLLAWFHTSIDRSSYE